jgi:hypothetical protein
MKSSKTTTQQEKTNEELKNQEKINENSKIIAVSTSQQGKTNIKILRRRPTKKVLPCPDHRSSMPPFPFKRPQGTPASPVGRSCVHPAHQEVQRDQDNTPDRTKK